MAVKFPPAVSGMSQEQFNTWFNKLPYTKQYDLQRKAGFPVADPDYKQLLRQVATGAGLPADSQPAEVLYTLSGGAIAKAPAPALFGIGREIDSFPAITITTGDYKNEAEFLYLVETHLEATGFNDQAQYFAFRIYADQKKINKLLHDLVAMKPHIVLITPGMQILIIPKQFFALVDALMKVKRIEYQFQIPKRG